MSSHAERKHSPLAPAATNTSVGRCPAEDNKAIGSFAAVFSVLTIRLDMRNLRTPRGALRIACGGRSRNSAGAFVAVGPAARRLRQFNGWTACLAGLEPDRIRVRIRHVGQARRRIVAETGVHRWRSRGPEKGVQLTPPPQKTSFGTFPRQEIDHTSAFPPAELEETLESVGAIDPG